METKLKNPKLEFCKDELKVLLNKLISGNYHTTAEFIFNSIAHTGVDTDLNPELKEKPTMEEFLSSK